MKVLVMNLLVVVVAITLTGKMDANTITITEQNVANTNLRLSETEHLNITLPIFEKSQELVTSVEERKVNIMVDDNSPNSNATATINVYSLDGEDVLGPYNVSEGEDLIVYIDERAWAVETLTISQNAELTYWITD